MKSMRGIIGPIDNNNLQVVKYTNSTDGALSVKWQSISPRFFIGLAIAAFFAISLLFRIVLPYNHIFVDDWIKFSSIDAYSHMRLVDNWAFNFPHLTDIDIYRVYPGAPGALGFSFFSWLITFVTWVIGFGSPDQHLVNVIGVYFPAILGGLTVIPAYFLGKALFNRWAGLMAAGLMAIMAGEFMGRSILGFTDQHVAETLFSMTSVLFLILAIKTAAERQLTYEHFLRRDFKPAVRPLVYSLLGGIFLAIYLLTWQGALLFVFIIALYFIIQFIIDRLRAKSSDYLGITGFILFFVSLIICLPFSLSRYVVIALITAVLIPPVLSVISRLISRYGLKTYYYPLILVGLGVVFIAVFYAVAPDILKVILDRFRFVFLPSGATASTTLEMRPFLSPQGEFSTLVAWGNYTTSFFLVKSWPIPGFALIAFVVSIWLYIKKRSDEKHLLLLFIWTLVMLVATLVQRRFAYYLVVNISLFSAYISWLIIWLVGLKQLAARRKEASKVENIKQNPKKQKKKRVYSIYHINVILAIIVVFFFVFFWNITKAKDVASRVNFAPSDAWEDSLHWVKDNTPDPFGDPESYYRIYPVSSGEKFTYPPSAYGVTAWWDYGYWISRTAHRLPSANPAQDPERITKVANLFLSRDETTLREIREELKSSYIIIDYDIASSKFWAIATWAGKDLEEFVGVYYVLSQGKLVPVQLYYPGYYHTLLVRLFCFDGEAVPEGTPLVITYEEKTSLEGIRVRQIVDFKEFDNYQEAVDFIQSEGKSNNIIVGQNPFISPVPLEAVSDYRLVYSSDVGLNSQDIGDNSEVEIFQYTGTD
jgi:oligosaccharyl transferase (archaeosortase A-associated)